MALHSARILFEQQLPWKRVSAIENLGTCLDISFSLGFFFCVFRCCGFGLMNNGKYKKAIFEEKWF